MPSKGAKVSIINNNLNLLHHIYLPKSPPCCARSLTLTYLPSSCHSQKGLNVGDSLTHKCPITTYYFLPLPFSGSSTYQSIPPIPLTSSKSSFHARERPPLSLTSLTPQSKGTASKSRHDRHGLSTTIQCEHNESRYGTVSFTICSLSHLEGSS